MLKLVTAELQGKVIDRCLQFFGGSGYRSEFPIARAFVDARMGHIGGGSIETMKQIIARSMWPNNAKPKRREETAGPVSVDHIVILNRNGNKKSSDIACIRRNEKISAATMVMSVNR